MSSASAIRVLSQKTTTASTSPSRGVSSSRAPLHDHVCSSPSPSASHTPAPLLSMHNSPGTTSPAEHGRNSLAADVTPHLCTSRSSSLYTCPSVPASDGTRTDQRHTAGEVAGSGIAPLPRLTVVTVIESSASRSAKPLLRSCSSDAARLHPTEIADGEDDAVEVQSCITLSSQDSSPSSSQAAPPPAPRMEVGCSDDGTNGADEEECRPLLSGGSSTPGLGTALTPEDAARHEETGCGESGSTEELPSGSSPSPSKPIATDSRSAHVAVREDEAHAAAPLCRYVLLDSESSGGATRLPAGTTQTSRTCKEETASALTTSTEATTTTTATSATTHAADTAAGTSDPEQSTTDVGTDASSAAPTPAAPAAAAEALSGEQQHAFHLAVREHRTVFITGGAGTGKSYLLRTIIKALPFSSTFVTATTGIAALNLSGTTLHSFAGCGVPDKRASASQIVGRVMSQARTVRKWRMCRVLVIDEVSMLEASFFDLIDYIARHVRNRPQEPFGGIQLILSGDFLQLPPVMRERRHTGAAFCFETETWINVNPKVCLLSTPFRQRDLRFFALLNEMRFGDLQPDSIALLHSIDTTERVHFVRRHAVAKEETEERKGEEGSAEQVVRIGLKRESDTAADTCSVDGQPRQVKQTRLELVNGMGRPIDAPFDGYTILRSTRAEVDAQNQKYYNQLHTEVFMYVGHHSGAGAFPAQSISPEVHLRVGCRVMLIKNFDTRIGLVNGSTGTVTGFVSYRENSFTFNTSGVGAEDARAICVGRGRNVAAKHTMLPVVSFELRLSGGVSKAMELVVEPQEWVEKEGDTVRSRSVQIPLVLAYAITIHKSQGMSLTQVDINFDKVFEAGQAYVALSRCTDLERVRLHGFNAHLVTANSVSLAYYKALALQQQRLEWQREHAPRVVAEEAAREAFSCTPYGYVLHDEAAALLHYGMEDSSHGAPADDMEGTADEDGEEARQRSLPGNAKREEEELPMTQAHQRSSASADLGANATEGEGDGRNETARLDELRQRISPLLCLADMVKRLVLREVLPLPRVRNARLVMDLDALFHLVTGPDSAAAFDVLFGEQENMMRVPLCVQCLIEEAAAYRSCSVSVTPASATQPDGARRQSPPTHASQPQSPRTPGDAGEAEARRRNAVLLSASDVAAEALAVMERAKQDFILDTQRPEQTTVLPEPVAGWMRFVNVLPLLRAPLDAAVSGTAPPSQQRRVDEEASANREADFILNRDPREGVQHRAIIEYALFLKASFGDGVAVCTESILLGAYALAWGLPVVSVGYLSSSS